MKFETKERTPSSLLISVEVEHTEIEELKKEAYGKLISRIKVPGFRQGKAPYEIGLSFIGEERLLEEVLELAVGKAISETLKKEEVNPISHPDVKVEKLSKDEILFTVDIEFLPEIEVDLERKREIHISISATEEEIQEKLRELQDSMTELQPVEREVQQGDVVEVEYEKAAGETVPFTVTAGVDKVVGDFSQQILGRRAGEKFEVQTESSKVVFKVNSVKEKLVPELDDNLAKSAGFDSLEALKEEISKNIIENKKLQAEENKGREVLRMIAEEMNIELPKRFVEEEVEYRLRDITERYLKRGKKLDDELQKQGKNLDTFKEELKAEIERELKEDLVIRRIVKKLDLKVSDSEVEDEFKSIIERENVQSKDIELTDEIRRYIRNELLRAKSLAVLKDNAIIISGGD